MQSPDDQTTASANCCPGIDELKERAEQFARAEPLQAVGAAFAVGLLLTLLPIGGLASVLVRLGLALLRPVLLVLGAVKLYEECCRRSR